MKRVFSKFLGVMLVTILTFGSFSTIAFGVSSVGATVDHVSDSTATVHMSCSDSRIDYYRIALPDDSYVDMTSDETYIFTELTYLTAFEFKIQAYYYEDNIISFKLTESGIDLADDIFTNPRYLTVRYTRTELEDFVSNGDFESQQISDDEFTINWPTSVKIDETTITFTTLEEIMLVSEAGAGFFVNEISGFSDIAEVPWASDAIDYLANMGFIGSREADLYMPSQAITRGEFAAYLVNVMDLYNSNAIEPFTDVDDTHPYAKYIASAYEAGILEGYVGLLFGPDDVITRQDMILIVMRALESTKEITMIQEITFLDEALIAPYARQAVASSVVYGLIQGVPVDGGFEFKPTDNFTRAEAAMVLYRLFVNHVNEQ